MLWIILLHIKKAFDWVQYLKHPGAGALTGQQTGVEWTGYHSSITWASG